jgi:hypothetical protein
MHTLAAALASALAIASCATTSVADDPPAPAPTPAPAPAPPAKEEPAPAPASPPKAEEPAPKPTSPEVIALLAEAAKKQGTAELVGAKAPTRYRAEFGTVVVHSEGNRAQTKTTEIFALPAPGSKEARLRSEWVTDAGKAGERKVILGHNGRFGWVCNEQGGTREVRRFTNPDEDAQDIKDLDDRRRMLRLALRVFFLGNLAQGPVPVTLAKDREVVFPKGNEGETMKVACRVLERAADPAEGEPPLRLFLDAKSLEPVAVEVPAAKEGESGFLLTVRVIDSPAVRAKRNYPKGVNVPDWLELFELPAGEDAKPGILIQAGLDALVIDAEKIPDSAFAVPTNRK